GVPHEVLGESIRVPQTPPRSPMSDGAIHLDHWAPSAGGRNGVAFLCVGLLSNSQRVRLASNVLRSTNPGAPSSSLMMSCIALCLCYAGFESSASRFRKAASPASDTSTHFGLCEASPS